MIDAIQLENMPLGKCMYMLYLTSFYISATHQPRLTIRSMVLYEIPIFRESLQVVNFICTWTCEAIIK